MGYSCTVRADYALEAIVGQLQEFGPPENGTSNGWTHAGKWAFYEVGRENDDGAITGTVWGQHPTSPDHCKRVGSFRIEPDGKITRFPHTTPKMRQTAEHAARMRFEDEYTTRPMFEIVM